MRLTIEQRHIARAMFCAVIFCIIYTCVGYYWLQAHFSSASEFQSRLQYTIKCDSFAGLMLLFGIMSVAKQRFFSSTAISGDTLTSDKSMVINIRYIQNTLEQSVLLFVTHLGLTTVLTSTSMQLIPVLVSLYIIGRLLFWVGYHHSALSRAFGFATTFYPTAVGLIYCCIKIIW